MKILDLGCGNRKRAGAIGLDQNPDTDADIVHCLDAYPYPFPNSTFDEIYADNVLEHLADLVRAMEELHRISKPGALVRVIGPYFRSVWAFMDPTHRRFFTVDSFSYFDPGHVHSALYNYSKARFKVEKTTFNDGIDRGWMINILAGFANAHPGRYERWLSPVLPLDSLTYDLRVIK